VRVSVGAPAAVAGAEAAVAKKSALTAIRDSGSVRDVTIDPFFDELS